MFDLRYHVASLAAVFFALIIGILVGVGISGRDVIRESERLKLQRDVDDLRRQSDAQRARIAELEAAEQYERETYDAVIAHRLEDYRVALVFIGPIDGAVRTNVEQAVEDAGGAVAHIVLKVPVDPLELSNALAPVAGAPDEPPEVGRALAQELLDGGETPLWDAVRRVLVEERFPSARRPVDGVVVARTADPQREATARFLGGLYNGLASGGRPAVAVETAGGDGDDRASFRVFDRYGFSTVDNVDTATGRVSLAILLAGGLRGQYGVDGEDGALPPVDPVAPTG